MQSAILSETLSTVGGLVDPVFPGNLTPFQLAFCSLEYGLTGPS